MKHLKYIALLLLLATAAFSFAQDRKGLDVNLSDYPYFSQVSFIHLNIQGEDVQMAYMDIKPSNPNGKSVLLLHGKNFSGNYWEQTAMKLSGEGYRVIIPDQVGFGKSSKPQHIQYSFQLLAINTKKLLDTLHISNLTVVGHSMGGMLATRFALMYPKTTTKLVLICPLGLEDYKLMAPYQTVELRCKIELGQDDNKLRKYMQENYFHDTWKPEYDKLLEIPSGWLRNQDYIFIAWNSALTYDMIFTQPVIYEFPYLKMPVLLEVGLLDHTAIGKDIAREEVKKMMGNFKLLGKQAKSKNTRITLVELNTGHLPQYEAFEDFYKPFSTFLAN